MRSFLIILGIFQFISDIVGFDDKTMVDLAILSTAESSSANGIGVLTQQLVSVFAPILFPCRRISIQQRMNYLVVSIGLPVIVLSLTRGENLKGVGWFNNFVLVHNSVLFYLFIKLFVFKKQKDPMFQLLLLYNDFGNETLSLIEILILYSTAWLFRGYLGIPTILKIINPLWIYTCIFMIISGSLVSFLDPV
jgi:hypothetical protein